MSLPTCGPLYDKALAIVDAEDVRPNHRDYFALGFMVGQMEKVYSGACPACMFRPPGRIAYLWQHRMALKLAEVYGLTVSQNWTSRGWEIWVGHETIFLPAAEDSAVWHTYRASLCGISVDKVDTEFHKRYVR